jgi:hypothetical protein
MGVFRVGPASDYRTGLDAALTAEFGRVADAIRA